MRGGIWVEEQKGLEDCVRQRKVLGLAESSYAEQEPTAGDWARLEL